MIEIRFHGRGGQGAVTSVELLALTAINEGKFAQGFPSFGPERRGAPVMAFCRVDDKHIRLRCKILQPDVVVVLDASLLRIQNPPADLRENGIIVLNTAKSPAEIRQEYGYTHTLALWTATGRPGGTRGAHRQHHHDRGAAQGYRRNRGGVHETPLKARFGRLAEKNFNAMKAGRTKKPSKRSARRELSIGSNEPGKTSRSARVLPPGQRRGLQDRRLEVPAATL